MDDGGQRLLDVIEDPHVLETFLRESFPSSALEDSPRFDNVSSSTDSGLVSSGLDSLVFDGQLVDPIRGGTSHSSHHAHAVTPHVLQQVLHSPNLSAASPLSGGPSHQLHHHQLHHQSQQVQPSLLSQHQSNHQSLPSLAGGLEADCIGRSRDSCSSRNDTDHHTLQQLLASSPHNSSQQILQLHPSHQIPQPHHQISQTQSNVPQGQQHAHALQVHSQPQTTASSHLSPIPHSHPAPPPPPPPPPLPPPPPTSTSTAPQVSSRTSLLQQQQQQQQQQHHHHHQQQHSSHGTKSQQQAQVQPSTTDLHAGLLSLGGLPATVGRGSSSRLVPLQSPPAAPNQQNSVTNDSSHKSSSSSVSTTTSKTPSASSTHSNATQSGTHSVAGRVQLVGGHSQVLSSGAQLLASGSQLLPGAAQIVHPSGSTHVLSGGSILSGGQVLSAPNVIPGGQVLSSVASGQVFQGGQLIPGAQVLANHLINTSHVLTTVAGIATPAPPLYVAPPVASHIQPPLSLVSQNQVLSTIQTSTTASTAPSSTSSVSQPPLQTLTSSTFTIPNKSPASLPRTSPVPYSATPSPHHAAPSPSYPNRSPAPSPHSLPGSMRSPAPPTPSPTVSSSQPSAIVSSPCPQGGSNFVSSMVGGVGMVQGLVSHLPLPPVGGTNGVVLTQGGSPMQVASGLKQVVPGSQLIQLVSSPQSTQVRQPIVHPVPKPIQPKQPQLLPKPATQANVRQPTPPPPGKTLIGARPNPPNTQQPIVLGNGAQPPTVITGQHNLGSIVLNSSLLQTGLQQPILIPQANGVQLLVRPAAAAAAPSVAASQGQTLLVPVPGQSQVTSVGKVPQPQTLVIPGSGQTPALVIPQGLAPALTTSNVFGAAQGARPPQPIIRFLAPQAPLQLQQINTPTGPTWVAVPVGQTLNLPGVFATPSGTVRALAPQVAPGTLQLAPSSITPPSAVGMSSIQLPGGALQVSSSPSLHLTISNSLPTGINTTASTCKIVTEDNASHSSTTTSSTHVPLPMTTQHSTPDMNKNSKKKSKKKKKERESKEDKKGKGVSINLNELLKETGIVSEMIFEESEFGDIGMEATEPAMATLPDGLNTSTVTTPSIVGIGNNVTTSTLPVPQPPLNTQPTKVSAPSLTVIQGPSLNVASNNSQPNVISSLPTSMCITLDAQGKFVLGSADIGKSVISSIAATPTISSQIGAPLHLVSTVGLTSTSNAYVFSSPEPSLSTSGSSTASSLGQYVTLHSQNESSPILKIDVPSQITSKPSPKNHLGNEMTKVAQNTQLLHTLQPEKLQQLTSSSSLINSILNTPSVTHNSGILPSTVSVHVVASDRGTQSLTTEVKKLPEPAINSSNELAPTHSSQVPVSSSAVIVSANLANSFIPGAKGANISQNYEVISASQPSTIPIGSINYGLQKKEPVSNSLPISMHVIESSGKSNSYQNQYLASVKTHTIMENCKPKKLNKKKKKDKELDGPLGGINANDHPANDAKNLNIMNSNSISSNPLQFNTQVLLTNGTTGSLIGTSGGLNKCDMEITKSETPLILGSNPATTLPVSIHPPGTSLGMPPVVSVITTSNSNASTISNFIPLGASAVSCPGTVSKLATPGNHANSTVNNVPSGFVFTGQQVLLQPGQQLKQLLITPQNQEALKRVHNQIQSLQKKKGPVTEQDKLLHQKLLSEHKKIMATGKPVAINPNPLSQTQQNTLTPQRSPVKYSHNVGHKKIFFTPPATQKKGLGQNSSQKDAKYTEHPKDKFKDVESGRIGENSLPSHCLSSSQISAITSFASMTTTVTTTSPTLSTPISNVCLQTTTSQQIISPVRVSEPMKSIDQETHQVTLSVANGALNIAEGSRGFSCNATPNNPNNTSTNGNYASVSIIFTSPKPIPVTNISPVFSSSTSTKFPVPHSISPCSASQPIINSISSHSQQGAPNASIIISPRQASTSQQSLMPATQVQTPEHNTISPVRPSQHLSFSLPLTRDQLFEHQLRTDQNGALNPDYKTPFKNKIDGCKRLIRYHVFDDCGASQAELMESDYQFELQSESIMRKFNSMQYKYKSLLRRESLRRHPSSENVMLYRLLNQEEKMNFEREKNDIRNGKEMSFIKEPSEWITNEDPLPDTTLPWEENWPFEKAFVLNKDTLSLEEVGVDSDKDAREEESVASVQSDLQCEDQSDGRPLSDWEEEIDEGQDEPRLQILMEDELEGEDTKLSSADSQESAEHFSIHNEKSNDITSKLFSSCDSDSVQSPSNDLCLVSSDAVLNHTHKNEGTKSNNSFYRNSKENKSFGHWPLAGDAEAYEANLGRFAGTYCNVKENGIEDAHGLKNNHPFGSNSEFFTDPNKKCSYYSKEYHKESLPPLELLHNSHKSDSRTDKNRRDKKYRTDKERKKHDKLKDKSRMRDKDLNKLSKKLRIKLRHEDKETVPPLRIRTDERGSGGLKLTLKKQEGSSDYYRVGEELGRGYKVKHKETENKSLSFGPNKHHHQSKVSELSDPHHLQKVSVVLQNCLHTDWKCKRDLEDPRSTKKSKRLKNLGGHPQTSPYSLPPSLPTPISDKYDFGAAASESNLSPLPPWGSSQSDRWQRLPPPLPPGNSSASSLSCTSPPSSSTLTANPFFYHSPHLPRDRSNSSQSSFIPYSQTQPHKNSQFS